MTEPKPYRTLIAGTILHTTGLSVGGSSVAAEGLDCCYRDGRGRLTIPGTGLAGALVETAARLFPQLVEPNDANRLLGRRITAKEPGAPQRRADEDGDARLRQSVWRFYHSHPVDANGHQTEPHTEWRQGVGIRQATGASAGEKKALYDFEFVPAGACWSFFLEIDTHRGGAEAEALAVLALNEWMLGFGWLGRSAARGTGWFELEIREVVRLACTKESIELWPDNSRPFDATLDAVRQRGAVGVSWEQTVEDANGLAESRASQSSSWQRGEWHYLSLTVSLGPGLADAGYGYDVLQVAGHPSVDLFSRQDEVALAPLSVAQGTNWRGEYQQPESPFVVTRPADAGEQPYLPGGGLRGPLRHASSRLERARSHPIRDPNHLNDPLAVQMTDTLKSMKQSSGHVRDAEVRALADSVAKLFGSEELCGRVLVSDARLTSGEFQLARVEHHAEDEFTAGVYAGSKFDRTVLLQGDMAFNIVVEAPTRDELARLLKPLLPALEQARLGHLPIGGGKWRGAGWVRWRFDSITLRRAGVLKPPPTNLAHDQPMPSRMADVLGTRQEDRNA